MMKIKVNLIEGNAKRKHLKIMSFEQLSSYLGLHYNKSLIKDFINSYIEKLELKKGDIIDASKLERLLLGYMNIQEVYVNHQQVRVVPEIVKTGEDSVQINIRIYVRANDNGCELLILV